MEINKKMYKYTAIISMTIVLMLIFNLFKPMITIADSTYGISSIEYNKDEEIMTVTCNKLDYHVNSFLYWVSTEEDIPTKDDLDMLANWCVNNAIKVVPLNTNSISDSIKIKKTGKYYAVMLLKKADEEGTEEYVKAFIARYVVNTPIKKDDLENQINKESLIVDSKDQEPVQEPEKKEEQPVQEPEKKEEQPAQEPEKKEEEQPVQEPEKKEEEQPAQEPEKKEEQQPVQEPEKKEEEQPAQEPKKEEEQQTVKENENKSNDDKPVYVNVNGSSNNSIIEDEYIDVVEEEPKNVDNTKSNSNNETNKKDKLSNYINESIQKAQNEKNKKTEEMRANVERMNRELNENKENASNKENKEETKKIAVQEVNSNNKNDANVEKSKNAEKEVKSEKTDVLENVQVDNQAKEPIPQTGNNDAGLVLGIIVFSIIGVASFVKYRKIK